MRALTDLFVVSLWAKTLRARTITFPLNLGGTSRLETSERSELPSYIDFNTSAPFRPSLHN